MNKVLLIAVVAAIVVAGPAVAGAQESAQLEDVVAAVQAQPAPAPARPATAPAAPAPARAQTPPPAPAPPGSAAPARPPAPPPAPPAPLTPIQLARANGTGPNVRFDVTITDTGGTKPTTKTLSLTIGSFNNGGSVRQAAQVPNPAAGTNTGPATIPIPLNVDVRNVNWLDNNGVRAQISVEYQPYLPDSKVQPGLVLANATTVFFDGRKTQILVTSDPVSDRKTTIEVTATILK